MIIDREISIKLAPREDGGIRVWSDDLIGLILSNSNQEAVLKELGMAIIQLRLHQEARAALARQEARKDENVEEWAQKLAEDLSKFTD